MGPAGTIANRAYAPKPGAPARPAIVREACQQLAGERRTLEKRYLHKIGNTTNVFLASVLALSSFMFVLAYFAESSSLLRHTLEFVGGVVISLVSQTFYRIVVAKGRNTFFVGSGERTVLPPMNAEFLFYLFLTSENCDAFVGDLEERYKLIHRKFGRRRANFWYWTQTVHSLGPIIWAWTKKVVMKPVVAVVAWAIARGLMGHDSWLAALVELYRKIRS